MFPVQSRLAAILTLLCLAASGAPRALAERVRLESGEFRIGGKRLQIEGLVYDLVPLGADPRDRIPPCLYARDLPLVSAMGANTIQTIHLLPGGDTVFVPLLASTGLYWLPAFPLDPYYDPAVTLAEKRDEILAGFRAYASRFAGNEQVLAYVLGVDVENEYEKKFAGPASDFHSLLEGAAAILSELDPEGAPMLATSVRGLSFLVEDPAGLSFWLWTPPADHDMAESLSLIKESASRPVLVSGFSAGTPLLEDGIDDEDSQARVALAALDQIENASFVLGALYGGYADVPGASGRYGLFRPEANTDLPGYDNLHPRVLYQALAERWQGKLHDDRLLEEPPELTQIAQAATGWHELAPGALARIEGKSLSAAPYVANGVPWPLHQAESCLCIGDRPAALGAISPNSMTALVPWEVEPGDHTVTFFRAGVSAGSTRTTVQEHAPGLFAGTVLRSGTNCLVTETNGVRPGELLDLHGTGWGPGTPSLVSPTVLVNGEEAEVLSSGLAPALPGVNTARVRVNPVTAHSPQAWARLSVADTHSNFIPLPVVRVGAEFGLTARIPHPNLVVQAGGVSANASVATAGINGYCGIVSISAPDIPQGLSVSADPVTVGQVAQATVSANADAVPKADAVIPLTVSGPGVSPAAAELHVTILRNRGDIPVRAFSGGYKSSYPIARFDWDNRIVYTASSAQPGRGFNILVVDPATGIYSNVTNFDTWGDTTASSRLVDYLTALPTGTLVMFAVSDDATLQLTKEARAAIAAMFNSRHIPALGYQESWSLIGRKGSPPYAESTSSEWVALSDVTLRFPLASY
jgi:uncharacterized protein (TIGR03437 family)